MFFRKRKLFASIVALLLIIGMACPAAATTVEPRASYYLSSYSAYIYQAGWGKIQVWITVDGVDYMDEIGALSIMVYESTDQETWTWVKTYFHDEYTDMLGYDHYCHSGHIEHQGVIGRYYKAYVGVWAGKDGEGDTRYFWTTPKKATLFAGETIS